MLIANPEIISWGARRVNRLVRREANRTVMRINHGMDWLLKQPPELVGTSPKELIFSYDSMKVFRYLSESEPRYGVPILLIPPLGVKPYVYDLMPGHSMAESLIQSGYRVYVIDFGVPEFGETLNIERYIDSWLPKAISEIRRAEKQKELTIMGYCLGGLFGVIYTAYKKDKMIKNLVTFATPFDGYALYPMAAEFLIPLNKAISKPIASFIEIFGTFPATMLKYLWRAINPKASVSKYFKLFRNLWNPEFIDFYNALDQWTNDFINYPADIVSTIYSTFLVNNDLVEGTFEINGKKIDISWISCPVLSFAGDTDVLVAPRSSKALIDTISSSDKAFYVVRGGHLGAVTGAYSPQDVWSVAKNWLKSRSSL